MGEPKPSKPDTLQLLLLLLLLLLLHGCGHCYYFFFYYYYHYCYYYSRLGTHENDDYVSIKYANT